MATCYGERYEYIGKDGKQLDIPVPHAVNDGDCGSVTLSGSSQTILTISGSSARFISVHADGGFHIAFGEAATTSHKHIPGDGLERWFDVTGFADVRVIQA